mgnify:CR=1 FL=1
MSWPANSDELKTLSLHLPFLSEKDNVVQLGVPDADSVALINAGNMIQIDTVATCRVRCLPLYQWQLAW